MSETRVHRLIRQGTRAALRWKWPIAASLFLLSPVLLFDVFMSARAGQGVDKISLFALPASVLWLVVAQSLFRRVWVAHAALFPFYLLTGTDLFLIIRYEQRLTSSTISMILENLRLAPDFIRAQLWPLIIGMVVLLALFAALLYAMRNLEVRSRRPLFAALAGLLGIYGGLIAWRARDTDTLGEAAEDILAHDRNSPFGVFPQGFVAYQVYEDALLHQRQSAAFSFAATRAEEIQEPEIYVFVIGESSRRDHWSLFGYERDTTPRLRREQNVIPLSDLVTQAALTQISVPLMLTRNSIEAPDARANEKSIVSAFKEAGFKTFWLSTQQRDHFTGAINRYSGEADHTRFFERRHDGVLVEAMTELAADARNGEKLFFVLHTQGSHFVFKDRYPSASARFGEGSLHDEYDNSVAYTDQVLSDVISWLRTRNALSGLVYVADHGENLYDDERQLFGHFLNNEYDMPIPGLLWLSDSYVERFPRKLAAAKQNAVAPLNTRVVFSTLADLGALQLRDMDVGKLSVLSESLAPPPRLFRKRNQLLDFDEWRQTNAPQRAVGAQR